MGGEGWGGWEGVALGSLYCWGFSALAWRVWGFWGLWGLGPGRDLLLTAMISLEVSRFIGSFVRSSDVAVFEFTRASEAESGCRFRVDVGLSISRALVCGGLGNP